jgi:hypothetical protein
MTSRPQDTIITAEVTELFDPEIHPPPRGVMLLVTTPGGCTIKAKWFAGCIAWGYIPKLPESVKARQRAKAEALLVRGNS